MCLVACHNSPYKTAWSKREDEQLGIFDAQNFQWKQSFNYFTKKYEGSVHF